MAELQLPTGDASCEITAPVVQSDWRVGLSVRRVKNAGQKAKRRWRISWNALPQGAAKYLRMVFENAGHGAGVITWENPMGEEIKARFVKLRITKTSAAAYNAEAEIQEAIEPCS